MANARDSKLGSPFATTCWRKAMNQTIMSSLLLATSCLAGCQLGLDPTTVVDGAPPGADGAPPGADIAHVPAEASAPGESDLLLRNAIIDTSGLAIEVDEGPAPNVELELHVQEPWRGSADGDSVPGIAILRVRRFVVARGATVRVVGAFPLVVIAGEEMIIEGIIDVSAGGAGAEPPRVGDGAGGWGVWQPGRLHSGGGGGGHALPGGRGGDALCDGSGCGSFGGARGLAYGEAALPILRGGSSGGGSDVESQCNFPIRGSAGGGALQLYSAVSIEVSPDGVIDAGGGGGRGGLRVALVCGSATLGRESGGGGGSGGAIVLQAPTIALDGIVSANGGGGGGGSGDGAGGDGQNGLRAAAPALGGAGGGGERAQAGGNGGWLSEGAEPGGDAPAGTEAVDGGAGGGGGAEGRIVLLTTNEDNLSIGGVISPAPHADTY